MVCLNARRNNEIRFEGTLSCYLSGLKRYQISILAILTSSILEWDNEMSNLILLRKWTLGARNKDISLFYGIPDKRPEKMTVLKSKNEKPQPSTPRILKQLTQTGNKGEQIMQIKSNVMRSVEDIRSRTP